jgi:hypothetical protein
MHINTQAAWTLVKNEVSKLFWHRADDFTGVIRESTPLFFTPVRAAFALFR